MSVIEKSLNFSKRHWIKILLLAIIVALIIALVCSVNYYEQENRSAKNDLQELQDQITALETEKDDLIDQKLLLEKDVDDVIRKPSMTN